MSTRAPIGYLVINGKEMCTNQGFKSFICSKLINNKFLYYYLKSIVFLLKQSGSGTTFDEISKTRAENIEISLPFPSNPEKSLKIQQQIVDKLDAFFEHYNKLKEQKQIAKGNYERILQSAINHLIFPKTIPENWKVRELKEVAIINMGQSPPSSTYNKEGKGLPFFQGKKEFGKKYPQVEQYCTSCTKVAEKGDILLSVRAPVGPINIANIRCGIGRGLAGIRVRELITRDYFYYFMKGNELNISFHGRGSTFASIKRQDVEKIKIPVPPKEEQEKTSKKINELFLIQEALLQQQSLIDKKIEQLPKAVLQKVFRGEL